MYIYIQYTQILTRLVFAREKRNMTHQDEVYKGRVWVDGCFDFTHHGHSGALLQARQTVAEYPNNSLVCGVHSDKDIATNKGALPVMKEQERYMHARAIRWTTEVVEGSPYVTEPEWMDKYGCFSVVHGDDTTLDADGNDCYAIVKKEGRFVEVKRTPVVSTTELIHRILNKEYGPIDDLPTVEELRKYSTGEDGTVDNCFVINGDDNKNIILGSNIQQKKTGWLVLSGTFDLFHPGDIEQLHNLHKLYNRNEPKVAIVAHITNPHTTIMSMKERTLSVLSCRYVDGLIIGGNVTEGPWKEGKVIKRVFPLGCSDLKRPEDQFNQLTDKVIMKRIENLREMYVIRNKKKRPASNAS